MRRMQRTRLSATPMALAGAAVPSGELSSTKITSHAQAVRSCASRSTRIGMLAFSLKVGTTIVNSGAGRTAAAASVRGGGTDGLGAGVASIADWGTAGALSQL